MAAEDRSSFGKRLNIVEQNIAALEEQTRNITTLLGGVAAKLDSLAGQFSAAQRTPWGVLLSGAGIMIALFGYAGSFYARDLGKVEKVVEKLERKSEGAIGADMVRDSFKELERRLDSIEQESARREAVVKEFERLRDRLFNKEK